MADVFKLTLDGAQEGVMRAAFNKIPKPLSACSTGAMRDVADLAVTLGRQSIVFAGMGNKVANALRSRVYPDDKDVLAPVGFIWNKVGWLGIFQTGGSIAPKSAAFLWIPIDENLPAGRTWTPKLFIEDIGPLDFVPGAGGHGPLLVGKVPQNKGGRTLKAPPRSGGSALSGKRRARFFVRTAAVSLPLFAGVSIVNEPKKISLVENAKRALDRYPDFLNRRLNETFNG